METERRLELLETRNTLLDVISSYDWKPTLGTEASMADAPA